MKQSPARQFLFDLALATGEWDVNKMERSMPLSLYYEWLAYTKINPFNQWRDDWRSAMVAAQISNILIAIFTKRGRRVKIEDLMPNFKGRKKKTPREIYALVKMAVQMSIPVEDNRAKK